MPPHGTEGASGDACGTSATWRCWWPIGAGGRTSCTGAPTVAGPCLTTVVRVGSPAGYGTEPGGRDHQNSVLEALEKVSPRGYRCQWRCRYHEHHLEAPVEVLPVVMVPPLSLDLA